MFRPRRYAGKIAYGHPGGESGREDFSVSVRETGRVVRAHCEMDAERLVRDTNWTLAADFTPIDGFVRVIEGGRITGTSSFRFDGCEVRCEAVTEAHGRISQTYVSGAPIAYLGLHPLLGDGLIAAARGVDRPGEEIFIDSITCSLSPNGETGMLAHPLSIGVRYVGDEEVTVRAGTFPCRRYALNWQRQWVPADCWTYGDDFIFVKMLWAQYDTAAELVELTDAL